MCPALCDPKGILQARILDLYCPCNLAWKVPWTEEPGRLQSMGSQRVRHWATLLTYFTSLLQGIFTTQDSNPGLPHCRWILYQLSHKGLGNIKIRVIQFSGKGIISWTEKQNKCNLKVFFFSFSFFPELFTSTEPSF